jgi:TRAP-type C4-dicarboxylate transport system substrate-binding protein
VALVVLQASGSWDRLPPDIKEVVSKNVNAAAVAQRQDVARLSDCQGIGESGWRVGFSAVE